MIEGLIVCCVVAVAIYANRNDSYRLNATIAVLTVTVAAYAIYYNGNYDMYVESFGYYGYQQLFPLASITALYFIGGRLAASLMLLYFFQMLIVGAFFMIEGGGVNVDAPYQAAMWLSFAIQTVLLFSSRATDVVYGGIFGTDMATDTTEGVGHCRDYPCSIQNNHGKAAQ